MNEANHVKCSECGRDTCNCEQCVKAKGGRRYICNKCARAKNAQVVAVNPVVVNPKPYQTREHQK